MIDKIFKDIGGYSDQAYGKGWLTWLLVGILLVGGYLVWRSLFG